MGYYTRFSFKARLKEDAPIELLNKIINENWLPNDVGPIFCVGEQGNLDIDHPFGKTSRWMSLFCGTNGEDIKTTFDVSTRKLNIESEFKDYDSEIEKFIDWITPFVQSRKKNQYVGYYQGESINSPINIYIKR